MNKRGMTLLEIVISLGILVIIVTSLTKVFILDDGIGQPQPQRVKSAQGDCG